MLMEMRLKENNLLTEVDVLEEEVVLDVLEEEAVSVEELLKDLEQDSLVEGETEEEKEDRSQIVLQEVITIVREKKEDLLVIELHELHPREDFLVDLMIVDHVNLEKDLVSQEIIIEKDDSRVVVIMLQEDQEELMIVLKVEELTDVQDRRDLKDQQRKTS